jgi:HK97 family phage major capsid protein
MEKKELEDALKVHADEIKAKQEEIKTASDTKAAELKTEVSEIERKRAEMQTQLDQLATDLKKVEMGGQKTDELLSLEGAIKSLLTSDEFKNAKNSGFKSKGKEVVFELKTDTSAITGTVGLTMQKPGVNFPVLRELSFINAGFSTGYLGQDKAIIGWVEGAYTSNVGYVGEGTGQATADTGTATEKSRQMAKISAKLPLTAEMLEDAEYLASALRMKLQENSMLFADGEIYDGNGADGGANAKHIYGIVGQSTAYSQVTTGSAGTVEKANIGDLLDDCILQAELSEQKGLNKVFMNPKDFKRFRTAKDANGQYLFVKDVNGQYTINGIEVVRTTRVTANTMTVLNSNKVQLWWKRQPEVKFSQMNGTDFVDDAYTAVLFLRLQCVIETPDQSAVIHVADIDASIATLTAPQA